VFNTEILNRYEQVIAHVCANCDATLAELNGAEDHVHQLGQYPPKVALSYLAAPLKQPHPGGCVKNFADRIITADRFEVSGPRRTSPDLA
jgi:putative transposase